MEIIYFFDPVDDVQFRVKPSGSLSYAESVGSNWGGVLSSSIIDLNTWTHVAVTKQDDNINIYINGVLDNSGQLDKNPAPDTLYIGAQAPFNRRYFNGLIDEVRIWDTARSMTSIQKDMYRPLQGNESGLVSYWQFNEGFSPVTGDTVSGNIGTLHNMDNTDWIISTAPIPYYTIGDGNWETNSIWAAGQNAPGHAWARTRIEHNITINSTFEVIELNIDNSGTVTITTGYQVTVGW